MTDRLEKTESAMAYTPSAEEIARSVMQDMYDDLGTASIESLLTEAALRGIEFGEGFGGLEDSDWPQDAERGEPQQTVDEFFGTDTPVDYTGITVVPLSHGHTLRGTKPGQGPSKELGMNGRERPIGQGHRSALRAVMDDEPYSSPYDIETAQHMRQRPSRVRWFLEILADAPMPTYALARASVEERNPNGAEASHVTDELNAMRRNFVRALGNGCVELVREAYDSLTTVPEQPDIPQYDPYDRGVPYDKTDINDRKK